MKWPQVVMIILITIAVFSSTMTTFIKAKTDRISSERATVTVFAWWAYHVAYVALLHAGGFW